MAVVYPDIAGLVVVDATGSKEQLNAEVWRHARLATARGLALVVEIYARSVLASRRLTEWWKSGDALMQETLSGIYLLRVDLQKYGPEAILRLTPYAVVGAPLFVGWNPIGQVCSRTQLERLTPDAMALPLSAFVEDVLAQKPHSLNPVPSLGNAERTREAEALRRVGHAWTKGLTLQQPSVVAGPKGAEVIGTGSDTNVEEAASTPAIEAAEAVESKAEVEVEPTAVTEPSATAETTESPLDQLLTHARNKFGALEDHVGTPLSFQLSNLQAIDRWVDALDEQQRLEFAKDFGAVLAVYVGDTIRRQSTADWVWEPHHTSASARLVLLGEVLGQPLRTPPIEWVVATLSDSTRSLYGQALGWCRLV
jgi:hypothetical protein